MSQRPIRRRADDGSVLILVLLLIVVGALIVLPLMTYTMSVLRLNTAVSARSQDLEAARAGLRVALADLADVFAECDDGGTLPSVVVNGETVTTTCSELEEIGPNEALGYQVAVGAVSLQLGSSVPATSPGADGDIESDPVPAYPAPGSMNADWWSGHLPASPSEPWDVVAGTLWMPELPSWPSTVRSATPFDLPAGFDTASGKACKVFFPGNYSDPVDLSGSTYYYFASGVYYFDQPVTVSGDADVVVGYGLEDFLDRPAGEQSECADDLQVAANVVSPPTVFAIDGGGATWVFGGEGRLVVDDSAGSPSIRFNQRYSEEDRGGRVSIMTVNGDGGGSEAHDVGDDPLAAHDVEYVAYVPRSRVLETTDPDLDLSVAGPIQSGTFEPSSSVYTAEARLPEAPVVSATVHDDGLGGGAVLLTWEHLVGNPAGGAPMVGYEVLVDGSPTVGGEPVCPADEIVVVDDAVDPVLVGCVVDRLTLGTTYDVTIAGVNAEFTGTAASVVVTPVAGTTVGPPTEVQNVVVTEAVATETARITWDAPVDDGGAPIAGYAVTAERVYTVSAANEPPVAHDVSASLRPGEPLTIDLPVDDPNGLDDTLTIVVDDAAVPFTATFDQPGDPRELTLIADATVVVDTPYSLPYSAEDASGAVDAGVIEVVVRSTVPTPPTAPVAADGELSATIGVPITTRLPAYDPNPEDTLTVSLDTTGLDAAEWSVAVSGLDLTIETTAAPGPHTIHYTVSDGTLSASAHVDIDVTEDTAADPVPGATCTVVPPSSVAPDAGDAQVRSWSGLAGECEVAGLGPLTGPNDIGYRFSVVARNGVGESAAVRSTIWAKDVPFAGGGSPVPVAPLPSFEPWTPEPIIDIRAGGAGATHVHIAGYVAVPMGRIAIDNPSGDASDLVALVGGVVAGTIDVVDSGDVDSVVGFRNDVVLQRKLQIVSRAGTATSTAVVQINEDGAGFAINSWVLD